jgi:spore germination protein GerM
MSQPGRVAALVLATLTTVAAACSIQPDTSPRDIPNADRALSDPLAPAEGGESAGSTRVYLVKESDDGTPHLSAVLRSVESTASSVMQELLKGPNTQEEDDGITTAVPRGLVLRSTRPGGGVVTVDVSSELLDEPAPKLQLAIAQIVFTASELEGVREVRVTVLGTIRPWPDGEGELRTSALTVYDYPGLVESAQPAFPPIPSPQPAA